MISTSNCRVYYSGLNSEFCLYLFTTIWLYLIFIVFIITFIVKYFLVTTMKSVKRLKLVVLSPTIIHFILVMPSFTFYIAIHYILSIILLKVSILLSLPMMHFILLLTGINE